jgi:Transglycosylase SLT domain/D-alanyl-D-alanine carboxypeptidase
VGEAGGGVATAAAVAVAGRRLSAGQSRAGDERARNGNGIATVGGARGGVLVVEVGAARRRGPTLLAAAGASELEAALRTAGLDAAARGWLCWLCVTDSDDFAERLPIAIGAAAGASLTLAHLPPALWGDALAHRGLRPSAGLLRAQLPQSRALVALAVGELRDRGLRARVASRAPGLVASRRALAGLEPGGAAGRMAERLAIGLLGWRRQPRARASQPQSPQAGQALPLVVGLALIALVCALVLAALGGAVTGTARVQRAADLAALSAARSMHDDFNRLFQPALRPDGSPNPGHLPKGEYLARASAAARQAARRNGVDPDRLAVSFPDARSFAPLRVRAQVRADLDPGGRRSTPVVAHAVAEAAPASPAPAPPALAGGGGYSGTLAYRQGKPMRPDVAAAFDRLAAAAARAGLALTINSAYRSDAEQARLFAANPDPRWVAPPGVSLHRCATELDFGPPSAYSWLAANATDHGFLRRYSWEPWHFGYVRGPAPCSAAGDAVTESLGTRASTSMGVGDGRSAAGLGLPAFVPTGFREPILTAAARWDVSAGLLAAQLMAESNFNPYAVSPAGARGIAQFMPATAAAYGLGDPFDVPAAIDAQAHLMSDLLRQFGSVPLALAAYNAGPAAVEACTCVPSYPETQAYVARILGLLGGAGELAPPILEVRLVA